MSHETVDVFDPVVTTIEVAEIAGARGPEGPAGRDGVDGRDGSDGLNGADGLPGRDGVDGAKGADGIDGPSAYELAVSEGFTGTLVEWLASLHGRDGIDGANGRDGTDGLSAYELAVAAGFVGTEVEWLASLVGPAGADGEKGDPGSIAPRSTAVATTASIDDGATWTGTITLGPGYRLYRIETDVPARIRLYATSTQRDADEARAIGTDPIGDHGLMFEYVTTAAALAAGLSPLVDGASLEDPLTDEVPTTITNRSGVTGTVTVTLLWAKTE